LEGVFFQASPFPGFLLIAHKLGDQNLLVFFSGSIDSFTRLYLPLLTEDSRPCVPEVDPLACPTSCVIYKFFGD